MTHRARILVIDDDPLFRSLLVSYLRTDYMVSVASEGSEGFYKALEHTPDVAIVDIQMPGWDGLTTLKAFRKHPSLSRVKIVILTSDASKGTVLAAIHGGANDYLIKTNFTADEVLRKLDKLLCVQTSRREDRPADSSKRQPSGSLTAASALSQSSAAETECSKSQPGAAPQDHTLQPHGNAESPHPDAKSRPGDDESRLQEMIDSWV